MIRRRKKSILHQSRDKKLHGAKDFYEFFNTEDDEISIPGKLLQNGIVNVKVINKK